MLKGSPVSDYIRLSSALYPKTDQRGHKRPDNPMESACDIGAYES
ncbi:MAG: choice-of-anchor Q domain-containing protein [Ktedonobacteraceae bacterium]